MEGPPGGAELAPMPRKDINDSPADAKGKDPKLYYITESVSLRELAQIFKGVPGCSFANLAKRNAAEGWQGERQAFLIRSRGISQVVQVAQAVQDDPVAQTELVAQPIAQAPESAVSVPSLRKPHPDVSVIATAAADKISTAIAEKISAAWDNVLNTAILCNAESSKILLSDRIKVPVMKDGEEILVEMKTPVSYKLMAAKMHQVAASTLSANFPRENGAGHDHHQTLNVMVTGYAVGEPEVRLKVIDQNDIKVK